MTTYLFVPGDDDKKLRRAASVDAACIYLDLEDAVAPERRAEARATTRRALTELEWSAPRVAVRVNGLGSPDLLDDVRSVVGLVDAVLVPKVAAPEDVAFVATLLDHEEARGGGAGRRGPAAIDVLVESPAAVAAVEAIAGAPERVASLVFGPGDYAAAMGQRVGAIGVPASPVQWLFAQSRIVNAAKAYGLVAVDGPWAQLNDEGGLTASCEHAAMLGFDGKLLIHPKQVEPCRRAFAPSDEEVAAARRLLGASNAAVVDGAMVDAASARAARETIAAAGGAS